MNIFGLIFGFIVTLLAGLGIWGLANMIWQGAIEGNLIMVIAGGILAYLFLGILIIVAIGGIVIILASILE